MRFLAFFALALATACRSNPSGSRGAQAAANDDSARVVQAEQALILALTTRDLAVLDSLLDSAFVFEGPDSTRPSLARSGFVGEVVGESRTVANSPQFGRFESQGDTADLALALSYRPGLTRAEGGQVDVYWSDRWIRRGGIWRLLRRQEVPQ